MNGAGSDNRPFYLGAGPLAALALGVAMIPLRGTTPVSNLAFAFIALTIAVAEYGGRGPALATAVASALSLNFFLTPPYLRLTIHSEHDVVAVVGLAVCGLIAAALGARRDDRVAALEGVRRHRDLLRAILRNVDPEGSPEARLTTVLRTARPALPLTAAVVRDATGEPLASCAPADTERPAPAREIEAQGGMLPIEGGRILLRTDNRLIGFLDVWGTGAPHAAEGERMLADITRLAALLMAGRP